MELCPPALEQHCWEPSWPPPSSGSINPNAAPTQMETSRSDSKALETSRSDGYSNGLALICRELEQMYTSSDVCPLAVEQYCRKLVAALSETSGVHDRYQLGLHLVALLAQLTAHPRELTDAAGHSPG